MALPDRLSSALQFGPRRRFAVLSFLGQGVTTVLLFAVAVLTARLLGADGKGVYSVWTLVTEAGAVLFGGSVSIGLGRAWLGRNHSQLATVAMRHGLLVAAVVVPACVVGMLLGLAPVPVIACVAIGVPLSVATNDLLVVLIAAKQPITLYAIRVFATLPLVAGLAIVAGMGSVSDPTALDVAFWLFAAGVVFGAGLAFWTAIRSYGMASGGSVREYARHGQGAYPGMVADWMIARIDRFIVPALAGSSALGIYSVAVNFAEVSVLAGNSIAHSMFEDESTLDRAESRRVLRLAAGLITAASFAVVVPAFFLISPIFGSEFADAKWVILLLFPGVVVRSLAVTAGNMLLARGKGRENSRIVVITMIVAVPTWTLGMLVAGIEGIALTVSLVYAMQMILTLRVLFAPEDESGPPPEAPAGPDPGPPRTAL